MLHIHNGDASADVFRRAGIAGDLLVWRELLSDGPTPAELEPDEFLQVRADHLAAAFALDAAKVHRQLLGQEAALEQASNHEEVVLWCEHDLACQAFLIYVLNRLRAIDGKRVRLSLICIDHHLDIDGFRGLDQLEPGQMAALFPERRSLSTIPIELGAAGWEAYGARDPRAIERFLQRADRSSLPLLSAALAKHLERFPALGDGLGLIERRMLEAARDHGVTGDQILRFVSEAEPMYGWTDSQCWHSLRRLCSSRIPLLRSRGPLPAMGVSELRSRAFELTDQGRAVLEGREDEIELNGIDRWLGGVHLTDGSVWRWDPRTRRLVQPR